MPSGLLKRSSGYDGNRSFQTFSSGRVLQTTTAFALAVAIDLGRGRTCDTMVTGRSANLDSTHLVISAWCSHLI